MVLLAQRVRRCLSGRLGFACPDQDGRLGMGGGLRCEWISLRPRKGAFTGALLVLWGFPAGLLTSPGQDLRPSTARNKVAFRPATGQKLQLGTEATHGNEHQTYQLPAERRQMKRRHQTRKAKMAWFCCTLFPRTRFCYLGYREYPHGLASSLPRPAR